MPEKPRHMLMIGPVDDLDCSSRIIHMANAFCEAGTRVSLICHPQRSDNAQELRQLLHKSASVYFALVNNQQVLHVRHVSGDADSGPEVEAFDLADLTDQSAMKLPQNLTEPKLARHVPPHLYQKYKDIMRLGWYGPDPFYSLIQVLIINKTIEPVDAIFCHDLWTLPVGCLAKELLNIPLLYDTHEIGTNFVSDSADREFALNNEKWMYELCDSFSTVSDACANYYKELCPFLRPLVLTNSHRLLWEKPAALTSLKERLSLSPDTPLAAYVGTLGVFHSHIDRFIEAIALCRSNLHLALVGDRGNMEWLGELSRGLNLPEKRVHFLGKVNYDKVFDTIYGADFGIIPNVQDNTNPVWSILSSKLFDYAQVELPIISDWAPEIQKIFDRFTIGQTVDFQKTPAEIAELLDGFYARVLAGEFPAEERKRARECFVWPKDMVNQILSSQPDLTAIPLA